MSESGDRHRTHPRFTIKEPEVPTGYEPPQKVSVSSLKSQKQTGPNVPQREFDPERDVYEVLHGKVRDLLVGNQTKASGKDD